MREPLKCPPQLAVLPDPSGLLAAVISNPADDTVRLAYADWLDEQEPTQRACATCGGTGTVMSPPRTAIMLLAAADLLGPDGQVPFKRPCSSCDGTGAVDDLTNPHRAEYIRLYIASLVRTSPDAPESVFAESTRRHHRIIELWHALFAPLVPPKNEAHRTARMDRGFIAEIHCSWHWWERHGDGLRAKEWVPAVRLVTPPDAELIDREHPGLRPTDALAARYPGTTFTVPATDA